MSERNASSALRRGDLLGFEAATGRRLRVSGEIVGGRRLGREIGFPTANLRLAPDQAPAHGVYAVWARISDGDWLKGAASFGVRPTFETGPAEPLLEVHLLDFAGDLYGAIVTIAFVARLRAEERFDGLEPLIAQMKRDCARARELLVARPAG